MHSERNVVFFFSDGLYYVVLFIHLLILQEFSYLSSILITYFDPNFFGEGGIFLHPTDKITLIRVVTTFFFPWVNGQTGSLSSLS